MSGIMWAVLGVAIGILLPFWLLRPRRARAPALAGKPNPERGSASRTVTAIKTTLAKRFHGVSIRPGRKSCAAAQALVNQRFLPAEAPPIPLKACDETRCQCAYVHYKDRRDSEDRRSGWGTFGGFLPTVPGGNRREKKPERRK